MAIGLKIGSASLNTTLGTAGAIRPMPRVMRPKPSAFAHAHELEADVLIRARRHVGPGAGSGPGLAL